MEICGTYYPSVKTSSIRWHKAFAIGSAAVLAGMLFVFSKKHFHYNKGEEL